MFFNHIVAGYKKSFVFKGRDSRWEFFCFQFVNFIALALCATFLVWQDNVPDFDISMFVLFLTAAITFLISFVASISSSIRRLNDIGLNWFYVVYMLILTAILHVFVSATAADMAWCVFSLILFFKGSAVEVVNPSSKDLV